MTIMVVIIMRMMNNHIDNDNDVENCDNRIIATCGAVNSPGQ